jgi:hypothetical protein
MRDAGQPGRCIPRVFKCHALPQTTLPSFSRAPVLLHNLAFSHCRRGWFSCTPNFCRSYWPRTRLSLKGRSNPSATLPCCAEPDHRRWTGKPHKHPPRLRSLGFLAHWLCSPRALSRGPQNPTTYVSYPGRHLVRPCVQAPHDLERASNDCLPQYGDAVSLWAASRCACKWVEEPARLESRPLSPFSDSSTFTDRRTQYNS